MNESKKGESDKQNLDSLERKIQKKLESLGETVITSVKNNKFPRIKMPIRSTSNIVYDQELGQWTTGGRMKVQSAGNVRQVKPFARMVWTSSVVKKELLEEGRTTTLRDVYYLSTNEGMEYQNQEESNTIIENLEAWSGFAREQLHIVPDQRSSIFGDIVVEYTMPRYRGRQVNLSTFPDGASIGPALSTAQFIETSAEQVLVIEKGATFHRVVEDGVWEKNKAIIVHTAGQPPRSTRALIRRLNEELGLPVYIFCDADPWGIRIALTVICGSASAAHLTGLATPNAVWIGLLPSDAARLKLGGEMKLSKIDCDAVDNMLELDPRCREDPYRKELEFFKKDGRKWELEALSSLGFDYVSENYIPEKIRALKGA
jgi:DNA topoisomerase-6 subunit A